MMTDEEWAEFTDFCADVRAKNQDDMDVVLASIEMDQEEFDRVTAMAQGAVGVTPSEEAVVMARKLVNDLIKLLFLSGDEVNVAKASALDEQKVFCIKQLAKGYEMELRGGENA